ncbi:MAG: ester cyclase [Actinomycetota bacterium]|nr:ester cyclase [Actinomycetota bacterium]
MSETRAAEVMRIYLTEVLSQRKFELIPELVADDMIDHTQAIRGPAALDAHARGFCENIPDLEIVVKDIFATDDQAVGIWYWSGTPINSMAESATGNDVYPRLIASVFRLENGKLAEYRAFVDAVDIATQLAAPAA